MEPNHSSMLKTSFFRKPYPKSLQSAALRLERIKPKKFEIIYLVFVMFHHSSSSSSSSLSVSSSQSSSSINFFTSLFFMFLHWHHWDFIGDSNKHYVEDEKRSIFKILNRRLLRPEEAYFLLLAEFSLFSSSEPPANIPDRILGTSRNCCSKWMLPRVFDGLPTL